MQATGSPARRLPPPALSLPALSAAELAVLRWLLPLALLHGLLYVFVVPPWQHYDEPTHFEYVALRVWGGQEGARLMVSREIADSLVRHEFLDGRFQADVLGPNPVPLGASQLVHPPTYYALVALPVGWLRYLPVEQQLYAARMVSVLLYALTVLAAWRIAVTVVPEEPVAQVALPLLVLLAPAFADLMAAVNNDVLLNMAAAAATLGCALLVREGPRPAAVALTALGFLAAVLSKRTGLALAPMVALAAYWALSRRPRHAGLLIAVAAAALLVVGFAAFQPVQVDGPNGMHTVLAARPWLEALDQRYLRLDIDAWIQSVTDLDRVGGRYRLLVSIGFVSFWTRLGWSDVALAPFWDWALAALTATALVGLAVGGLRDRARLPLWQRRCILLFVVAVASAWLALAARLHPLPPLEQFVYTPRGRYMFWALIPTLWLLFLGLQRALPGSWRSRGPWLLVGFFVALDLAAVVTLLRAHV